MLLLQHLFSHRVVSGLGDLLLLRLVKAGRAFSHASNKAGDNSCVKMSLPHVYWPKAHRMHAVSFPLNQRSEINADAFAAN